MRGSPRGLGGRAPLSLVEVSTNSPKPHQTPETMKLKPKTTEPQEQKQRRLRSEQLITELYAVAEITAKDHFETFGEYPHAWHNLRRRLDMPVPAHITANELARTIRRSEVSVRVATGVAVFICVLAIVGLVAIFKLYTYPCP